MGCGISVPENRVADHGPPTPEPVLPEDPSGMLKLNIKQPPKQLVEGEVLIYMLGTVFNGMGWDWEKWPLEFQLTATIIVAFDVHRNSRNIRGDSGRASGKRVQAGASLY
jgi:hypothetical protein